MLRRLLFLLFFVSFFQGKTQSVPAALPEPLSKLVLRQATQKDAARLLSRPDAYKHHVNDWSKAGHASRFFYTTFWYKQYGCMLQFYSVRKNRKNRKKLISIEIRPGSPVAVYGSLRTLQSDTSAVLRIKGKPVQRSKNSVSSEIFYVYGIPNSGSGQTFYFDEKGKLTRVIFN